MRKIIGTIAVCLLALAAAGAMVACSDEGGSQETDINSETVAETEAETDGGTTAETDTETDTEAATEVETACDHTYIGEACSKCGAAKTYHHTVIARYDSGVSDAELVGKTISGVTLVVTDGTRLIAQGTTDEKGEFSFEAPAYQAPDSDLLSYSVMVIDGAPEGYSAGDSSYFFIGSYTCSLDFYQVVLPDPNTAFNPQIVPIGSTVHTTMPELREGDAKYYYAIQPSKPEHVGLYRITVSVTTPGVTVNVGHYASNRGFISSSPRVSASGENPSIEILLEEQYMKDSTGEWSYPNRWVIGVYVEGDATYPVEYDLTVERVRDLIPGKDYEITERTREQMMEGAPRADEIIGEVTGELTYVDTAATLVKDDAGYYHVGSADGPLVVLNLKNPNRIFGGGGDASFLNINSVSGIENLLVSRQGEKDGLRYVWVSYYYDMIAQYAEQCNEDGVYPLNEQLHDFLRAWVNQRVSSLVKGDLDEDHAYLLACSYYA